MSVAGELDFLKRVDKALHDPQMRSAVPFTQDRLRMGREQATHELGNMEEWRGQHLKFGCIQSKI